jgi:hypothetical protein
MTRGVADQRTKNGGVGSEKCRSQTRVELRKRARVEQRKKTRDQRSVMPMWPLAHGSVKKTHYYGGHMGKSVVLRRSEVT